MFSSYLRASLIILATSAVTASAAPDLTVKTSTSNVEVDGLENLKVTTTITNTGDETLKLLNDPRGILDAFPENSFNVINATGSRPLFNGARVKFSPTYAASLDEPSVFTVLAPGASVDVVHDLSAAYNFTRSGAGNYSIEPSNLFTYIDADGTPKNLYATVEDTAAVNLSGNLAVSRVYNKRASFDSCTPTMESQLNSAAASAQNLAFNAYAYVVSISSGTYWYTRWFGTYDASRIATVQNHFELIGNNDFSSFTYNCGCPYPTYSFIFVDQPGKIWICDGYWSAPNTGTDSKAGTLIHLASRWNINGGALDYASGQSDCLKLARSNPAEAIMNADSYEYFAENNPPQ